MLQVGGDERQFRSILAMAADSAKDLRPVDVDRVLDAAKDQGVLVGFTAWLLAHQLRPRVEQRLKSEISPPFEKMVEAAIDWKYLALKHAQKLSHREQLVHSRKTTKGDLDKWLMDRFGIDASTARDVANQSMEEGTGQFHVYGGKVYWTGNRPEPSTDDYVDLGWLFDERGKLIGHEEISKLPNGSVIHVYYQGKKHSEALVVNNPLSGALLGVYFDNKSKPGTWQRKPISPMHLRHFVAGRYGDYYLQEKRDGNAPAVVLTHRMATLGKNAGASEELAKRFVTERFRMLVHHADKRGNVHDGFIKLHLDAFFSTCKTELESAEEQENEQQTAEPEPEGRENSVRPKERIKEAGDYMRAIASGINRINLIFGRDHISTTPIDETKWQQIRPILKEVWDHAVSAGKHVQEFVPVILDSIFAEGVPYLERFIKTEFEGKKEETDGEDLSTQPKESQPVRENVPGEPSEEPAPASEGAGGERRDDGLRTEDAGVGDRGDKQPGDEARLYEESGGGDGAPAVHTDQKPVEYEITEKDNLGRGGAKTKFKDNITAIRTFKRIRAESRDLATPEEQAVLVKYVGWGGLPQAFQRPDGTIAEGWEKEAKELREILTDEEYGEARRSTQNAHYTSEIVIRGIYDAMEHLGFTGGKVLEPGAGIGNFIGLMPKYIKAKSTFTAVELDPISGGIAKLLYPKQTIHSPRGFQEFDITPNSFDAVVGNPPFGDKKLYDPKNKHLKDFSIHNFFFAKAIDGLRPGGVLAMVTSNYLMDKHGGAQRRYFENKTRLLGAIRLPNTAFLENANTEVTADIIFLQKLEEDAMDRGESWSEIRMIPDPDGKEAIPVNGYFVRHPDMMLGIMARRGTMYGLDHPALVPKPGQHLAEALKDAIAKLPQDVFSRTTQSVYAFTDVENLVGASAGEMGYAKVDGFFVTKNEQIARRLPDENEQRRSEIVKDLPEKATKRIAGMVKLRDVARTLMKAELDDEPEGRLKLLRNHLNDRYDTFVGEYGYIHQIANKNTMKDDPDYPFLLSLEKTYDPGISRDSARKKGIGGRAPSAEKADIFTKRIREPYHPPTSAGTPEDALTISLAETGRVDLAFMAKLTDKTEEDLAKSLKGRIFLNPNGGWEVADEYLSGNVKKKLREAREAAEMYPDFREKVEALEKVQPEDIPAAQIRVRAGTHWIPTEVYQQFYAHLTKGSISIRYNPLVGGYDFTTRHEGDWEPVTQTWGTSRIHADKLLELIMGGRAVAVYDIKGDGTRILNESETQLANVKADSIRQEFDRWIFEDKARRDRLERIYNEEYNTHRSKEWDGTHLTFPGKNPNIDFRRHQRSGAWRLLQKGKGMLDHSVGAGKTFLMIAVGIEGRRMGLIRKPMYVVPNHMVPQWTHDFYELYPGANILAITKEDFKKENRRKFLSRIATGNWDAIVIAHSSFGFIPNPIDFEQELLREEISLLEEAIKAAEEARKRSDEKRKPRTVKQMESRLDKFRARLEKLNDMNKDEIVDFSELGVDWMFVDEAHEFKNLFYNTQMQRVAGLGNPEGNKKTLNLFIKVQYLLRQNNDRGVVFASGTPIANSIAEMYHMQRYLQYDDLKALGLHHFDAWANTFANPVTDWELDPTGTRYKMNTRLKEFVNLPELMALYHDFSDVMTLGELKKTHKEHTGNEWPVPKIKGGKPQNIVVERSSDQESFMEYLVYRMDHMPKDGAIDNPLKTTSEGRKAALDMRLIDSNARDYPGSKVNRAAKEIVRLHHQWASQKGTQLVFCDLSIPKAARGKIAEEWRDVIEAAKAGDEAAQEKLNDMSTDERLALLSEFSVYDDLKDKLIEAGIPASEIAFIHEANTDKQKEILFERMREGKIRVLMGSTQKMGAGMNVQKRLVALHHLDCPWRPADLEQREGRIIRQGNTFYEADPDGFVIEILRYATKQTIDARMWQTIESKAHFISQAKSRHFAERTAEDISMEAANSAEMKAAASGNPLILEEVQLRSEIRKLRALEQAYRSGRWDAERQIAAAEEIDERTAARIALIRQDIATAEAHEIKPGDPNWRIEIMGNNFKAERLSGDPKKDQEIIENLIKCVKVSVVRALEDYLKRHRRKQSVAGDVFGHYRGFPIIIGRKFGDLYFSIQGKHDSVSTRYKDGDNFKPGGWLARMHNAVEKIKSDWPAEIESSQRERDRIKERARAAEKKLKKPFEQAQELKWKEERHSQVLRELEHLRGEQGGDQDLAALGAKFARWIALGYPNPGVPAPEGKGIRIVEDEVASSIERASAHQAWPELIRIQDNVPNSFVEVEAMIRKTVSDGLDAPEKAEPARMRREEYWSNTTPSKCLSQAYPELKQSFGQTAKNTVTPIQSGTYQWADGSPLPDQSVLYHGQEATVVTARSYALGTITIDIGIDRKTVPVNELFPISMRTADMNSAEHLFTPERSAVPGLHGANIHIERPDTGKNESSIIEPHEDCGPRR